jgi:Endonuclease/Exonuclease/phosphatase family.
MNHWQRTLEQRAIGWESVQSGLGVDVALLQETEPPPGCDRDRVLYREIADYRPWGSAVVSTAANVAIEELSAVKIPGSRRRFRLTNTFPGSVVVARLTIDGVQPITAVSLYVVNDGYAHTTMLRVIADLLPLFDSGDGARVIVGGDFNMSTADSGRNGARAAGVLEAFRSLGLAEVGAMDLPRRPAPLDKCACGQGQACRHFNTWKGAQLDYLFVTPSLSGQVRSLEVGEESDLSDHRPVIASFDLDPAPIARQWDEDQFATEIERRHGPDVGHAVRELIDWAQKKEVAVRETGRRDVGLTAFPTTVSADPEMRWQIDVPRQRPVSYEYLISIRAAGDVVLQFQWMVWEPFESPEKRGWILDRLAAVGIEIPRDRLNGRPSFALAKLADSRVLAEVKSILDRLVDETRPHFSTDAAVPEAAPRSVARTSSEVGPRDEPGLATQG